jgi:hypothetical protein
MLALAVVLALVLVAAALGTALLWAVGMRSGSPVERFCFAAGLGLGLIALCVMYVALNGQLHSPRVRTGWTGGLAVFGCIAVILIIRWIVLAIRGGRPRPTVLGGILVALIVVSLAAGAIASLAPPTAPAATAGSLRIAHRFLQHGGTRRLDDVASNAPLNAVMLYLPLMKLAGDAAPGALSLACLGLAGLAMYAAARARLPVRPAIVAAATVFLMPLAAALGSDPNDEIVLTLFVTLAFAAFARWWDEERAGWLVLSGVFVGFAAGTGYVGLFALVLLLVGVIAKAIAQGESAFTLLSHGAAALLIAAAVGCPWYLRNAKHTGNPFYPLLADVIPTRHISARPAEVPLMIERSDYPTSARDLLLAPVAFTIGRDRGVYQAPTPDGATRSPGLPFLAFVPLLLLLRPRPSWAKLAFGGAVLGTALVLPMYPLPRYVLPFFVPAVLCVGHAFERLSRRGWARWSVSIFLLAALAVQLVPFAERAASRWRVAVGRESRDACLSRLDEVYPMAKRVRETARGLPVLVVGERLYYFLDQHADATLGMPLRQTRVRFEDAARPADLLDAIRKGGFEYVVVNEDLLDRRAPFALDLLRPLAGHGLRRLEQIGSLVLYRVEPPPAEPAAGH